MATFLYAFADSEFEWNCSQWRSLTPSDALNASGQHTARCIYLHSVENFLDPAVQDIVGPADFIIVQRNLVKQSIWDFCDYWRGMMKLVVADLDDAYQIIPWSNPAHAYWKRNAPNLNPEPVAALAEGLKHVDALTAPSRVLLQDWAHIVPGYWLPNWAQGAWYQNLSPRARGKDRFVIGWGGSVSHYDSWWGSGIREGLQELCREFSNVVVKICGNDSRIYHQLPVPKEQKLYQPGVKPQDWPKVVNTFDIGIAPLFGLYDQRRSWIKGVEYMLVGIPWVATAGLPYADLVDYGLLVDNSPETWYAALKDVVLHYPDYLGKAQANREAGWAQTIERNIDNYVTLFTKIAGTRRDFRLPGIAYCNWSPGGGDEAVKKLAQRSQLELPEGELG